MRSVRLLGIAFMGCLAGGISRPAMGQSIGFARMPSTVAQYFGFGYGAGRHAPIVRTPGYRPERAARMAFVPYYYGPLQPAPYAVTDCHGDRCARSAPDGQFWYGPGQTYPAPPAAAPAGYLDPSVQSELRALPPIAPPGVSMTTAPRPASFR